MNSVQMRFQKLKGFDIFPPGFAENPGRKRIREESSAAGERAIFKSTPSISKSTLNITKRVEMASIRTGRRRGVAYEKGPFRMKGERPVDDRRMDMNFIRNQFDPDLFPAESGAEDARLTVVVTQCIPGVGDTTKPGLKRRFGLELSALRMANRQTDFSLPRPPPEVDPQGLIDRFRGQGKDVQGFL